MELPVALWPELKAHLGANSPCERWVLFWCTLLTPWVRNEEKSPWGMGAWAWHHSGSYIQTLASGFWLYGNSDSVLGIMEGICFPFASQNNPMEVFVKVHRLCVWRWWRTRTDLPSPLYWDWAPRNHGPHPRFPNILVYFNKESVSRFSARPCHMLMKLTIKSWPISFGKE